MSSESGRRASQALFAEEFDSGYCTSDTIEPHGVEFDHARFVTVYELVSDECLSPH